MVTSYAVRHLEVGGDSTTINPTREGVEKEIRRSPMATRREPRQEVRVAIRIFGADIEGKPFTENTFPVNVSRSGAMAIEIQTRA